MIPVPIALLIICTPLSIWALYRLYDRIRSDAMHASRVEIGREIERCCGYFSRDTDAQLALQIAAAAILAGELVDGERVHRKYAKARRLFKDRMEG